VGAAAFDADVAGVAGVAATDRGRGVGAGRGRPVEVLGRGAGAPTRWEVVRAGATSWASTIVAANRPQPMSAARVAALNERRSVTNKTSMAQEWIENF
jgi:hypothetical protein